MKRTWLAGLGAALLVTVPGFPAHAEIVERELGTDANGRAVTGYVFQAGRSFRRSSRSTTSLRPRRVYRPSRGIVYRSSYGYPYRSGCWTPLVPIHCGFPLTGSSISIWHGSGSCASFTVIR